jgi:NAD-dependent dihydropyrimidine dehydrogenase PreA subunit
MSKEEAENKKEALNETEGQYRFVLDDTKCIGCQVCAESCPNDVLEIEDGCPVAVQPGSCEGCEVCAVLCEQEAIEIEEIDT